MNLKFLCISYFVSFMTFLFGTNWLLFFILFIFNVIHIILCIIYKKVLIKKSSLNILNVLIKIICTWLLILLSFLLVVGFEIMETIVNIDLSFTYLLGWLVLISSIIHEMKHIITVLVNVGIDVPSILVNKINKVDKIFDESDDL